MSNDEQAKYDAIKRHGVDIPGIGTVANLADVQRDVEQPTERQPMLSASQAEELAMKTYPSTYSPFSSPKFGCWVDGANAVRDFYEDLITTGKLRVVEEVEWEQSAGGIHTCNGCNSSWDMSSWIFETDRKQMYCPACGNKRKRP